MGNWLLSGHVTTAILSLSLDSLTDEETKNLLSKDGTRFL